MKTNRLLVLIALATQLPLVAADDKPSSAIPVVDTSKWKCKYCEVEEGWSGDLEAGLGYVSDDSFKFGEYNGLNKQGTFFIGDANLYYRNENAGYIDLSVSDFGLDSRSLSIEGGTQGSYAIFLSYDELPHFTSDSASTPYQGVGSDNLTLPGWVPADTTGGMTGLASGLQNVAIETQRKQLVAGATFVTESPWEYTIKFRHDTKLGSRHAAGAFFFNSAQLIEPVDYVTDEIDASVSYTAKKWQTNFAYYGSTFRNSNKSLTWENAYTPSITGADTGELAPPPDNQFHQIILSTGYEISDHSRISGDIAFGRMEQNETLLAATQNNVDFPALAVASGNSVNAEVDTTNAKLRFISMLTDRLRLDVTYSYNDRDNKTPQLLYDWVITDGYLATQRANLPYGITQSSVKLNADYKHAKGTRLGVGYDMDSKKRTFQDVEKTDENTLWGTIRVRNIDNIYLEIKLAHSVRDTSAYQAGLALDPQQNILHSKYNMADRDRNSAGFHANIMPRPEYAIGLSIDYSRDNYDNSVLGLTNSRDISMNGDVTVILSEKTSLNFFIGQEKIKSNQSGHQSFPSADWIASNDDTFDNMGLSVTHVLIEDKLDIGADYTHSRSSGKITVTGGAPDPVFPDLTADLNSVRLYANYHLDETLSVRAAYWHESYESSDWALDGISADTIPNLLSLGELSPAYSNDVIKLSMNYRF